jgi:meiotic recombination protein REC8
MVLDDPAFLPELELPPLQDFESLASNFNKSSQRSSQSMMSIDRERGSSVSSMSVAALEFPSSSRNSMLSYQLPNNDPFALSSAHKPVIGEDRGINDEEHLLYDDAAFEFDDEGNLRDISPAEINARQIDKKVATRNRLSSSAASERVRADHAIGDFEVPDFGGDDYGIQYGREEELPDAEPFSQLGAHNKGPFMSGGLQQDDQPLHMNVPDLVSDHSSGKHSSEEPSFESAEAPIKRRRTTKKEKNLVDTTLALTNNDLRRFKDSYLASMAVSIQHSNNYKAAFQARKNAQHFVFGTGIMGVGNGLGSFSILSPLQSFAGDALKAKITGMAVPTSLKRNRDTEKPDQDNHSPKRVRGEDEIGRGYDDEVLLNFDEDMPEEGRSSSGVEIGRDAPSALPDFPSSAMPWNVSASVHSHQRGLSSRKPGSLISVCTRRVMKRRHLC